MRVLDLEKQQEEALKVKNQDLEYPLMDLKVVKCLFTEGYLKEVLKIFFKKRSKILILINNIAHNNTRVGPLRSLTL